MNKCLQTDSTSALFLFQCKFYNVLKICFLYEKTTYKTNKDRLSENKLGDKKEDNFELEA